MTTRRVVTYDCPKPGLHAQPCWHAKCAGCKTVLTAFDFTEEDARELAEDSPCKCETEQQTLEVAS